MFVLCYLNLSPTSRVTDLERRNTSMVSGYDLLNDPFFRELEQRLPRLLGGFGESGDTGYGMGAFPVNRPGPGPLLHSGARPGHHRPGAGAHDASLERDAAVPVPSGGPAR